MSDQEAGGCPPLQKRAGTVIVSPATSTNPAVLVHEQSCFDGAAELLQGLKRLDRSNSLMWKASIAITALLLMVIFFLMAGGADGL
jgi:hypothetical protein